MPFPTQHGLVRVFLVEAGGERGKRPVLNQFPIELAGIIPEVGVTLRYGRKLYKVQSHEWDFTTYPKVNIVVEVIDED